MTLTEIIERLEKADGPDRLLDIAIADHLGLHSSIMQWPGDGTISKIGDTWVSKPDMPSSPRASTDRVIPYYTGNLQAALTLFPVCPDRISTDPIKACLDALKARAEA